MLLLLSNNINIQSPWMLSLEIFGSVCAAAADYRQIGYRPSIPAGASKVFINEYNNTSQFFTSSRKISCSEKSFHIFHFSYILNEWDWTYRRICRCLFTLFRPCDVTGLWKSAQFLLEFALHVLPLDHILWSIGSCQDQLLAHAKINYWLVPRSIIGSCQDQLVALAKINYWLVPRSIICSCQF